MRGVFVPLLLCLLSPHAALAATVSDPRDPEAVGPAQIRPAADIPNEAAPPNPVSLAAGVGLLSRGLWRGLALGAPAVLETTADVAYHSATLGIVSSTFVGPHVRPGGQMAGFDMNLAYDISAGPVVVAPALNVFSYPGAGQTTEVSISTSVDLGTLGSTSGPEDPGLGSLSVHTQQALDVMSNQGGWYADGGVAWSRELSWDLTLDVDLTLSCYSGSFARFYVDESITGARVGATALDSALTYPATDWLALALRGAASTLVDPELRHSMGSDAQLVAAGLAVSAAY